MRQQPCGVAQLSQFAPAFGTRHQMILQRPRLCFVKRIDRRRLQQLLVFLMLHQN